MKIIVPDTFKKLVCSYHISKQLKDLGIVQDKSLMHWFVEDNAVYGEHITCARLMNYNENNVSAFLATELAYAIGHRFSKPDLIDLNVFSKSDKEGSFVVYLPNSSVKFDSQPTAYGHFLVKLIEHEMLTVDDINNRLKKFL